MRTAFDKWWNLTGSSCISEEHSAWLAWQAGQDQIQQKLMRAYDEITRAANERMELETQLLEAQAQVEVMRKALLSCGQYKSGIT